IFSASKIEAFLVPATRVGGADVAELTEQEAAHARSIGDVNVTLAPVPPTHKPKILIASVIRKPAVVVAALLKTLAWQRLRKPADIHYAFVTDFPADSPDAKEVKRLLAEFSQNNKNTVCHHATSVGNDFAESATGHHWTSTAWHRVGAFKNGLIQRALDGR